MSVNGDFDGDNSIGDGMEYEYEHDDPIGNGVVNSGVEFQAGNGLVMTQEDDIIRFELDQQITADLDYDKIFKEMEKRGMAKTPAWRNSSLSIRTRHEIKCIDTYDSYSLRPLPQWLEETGREIQNLGTRQVVLLAFLRHEFKPPVVGYDPLLAVGPNQGLPLCFFYTWEAAEKALDLIMATNNGVIDLRDVLDEGKPEVDEQIGKEQRPIDLGGPAVHEPTPTSARPTVDPNVDFRRQLERLMRERATYGQPMMPPQGDQEVRADLIAQFQEQLQRAQAEHADAPRGGLVGPRGPTGPPGPTGYQGPRSVPDRSVEARPVGTQEAEAFRALLATGQPNRNGDIFRFDGVEMMGDGQEGQRTSILARRTENGGLEILGTNPPDVQIAHAQTLGDGQQEGEADVGAERPGAPANTA